jgi:hypothetical protein
MHSATQRRSGIAQRVAKFCASFLPAVAVPRQNSSPLSNPQLTELKPTNDLLQAIVDKYVKDEQLAAS